MDKVRKKGIVFVHTDDELRSGSYYLRYHIRMYIETLHWLQDLHHNAPEGWNTVWNAILENHLIHARVLIDFLSKTSGFESDILAIDFFYDQLQTFHRLDNPSLGKQKERIGGRLVHITTKIEQGIISQTKWPTDEIASILIDALKEFLYKVPEHRLADRVKTECLDLLPIKPFREKFVSFNSST